MNIAICAIVKNEDFYIEEFIKYHLKLGIDHIYFFENNWRYDEHGKFRENFHVHWLVQDGEVQQLNAYNRFLHNSNMWIRQHDAIAFIDADEYICVRDQSRTLQDILEEYSQYLSLAINWRLFGSSGLSWDGSHDVVTRFTKCGKDLNRHVKQIVFPKSFKGQLDRACFTNPHHGNWAAANLQKNAVIGPFNTQHLDQVQPLELNHYAIKTWDECLAKCARGRADYSVKRNAEEFFKEHDKNDIENTVAKEFYLSK